jgi:hypothetical protein
MEPEPDLVAERVARNQSAFRDANEQVAERAETIGVDGPALPFICECPDPACTAVTLIDREAYERIRAEGNRFFAVPGHETCVVDGVEVARVVERHDTFSMLEKIGVAKERAEELDPRS